jgi:hypothetical protein
VLVGVAVAATERDRAGAIIAAALALPGVLLAGAAQGQGAPEQGLVSFRHLEYRDSQPGLKRTRVSSPSLYLLLPLSSMWAVEGSLVYDSVSGATPRYHSAISGATPRMSEERRASDVKLTHYRERSSYSLGLSRSSEHDFHSRAFSLGASFSSDDNNRTWNFGLGHTSDRIGSTEDATLHERRRTTEWMAGLTQALNQNDLVQLNLALNLGRGFYSDPYKLLDMRPNRRDQAILLLRWNHHFADHGSTLRSSYRYYRDSFGVKAHTLGAEWVLPAAGRFTLTPSLRLYSQSAARFYHDAVYDPLLGEPFPPGYLASPPQQISLDQRLSAFGGVTVGVKLAMQITADWSADLKIERYEQRSRWRWGGGGSPGIDPFRATFVQIGVTRRF